MFIVVHILGFSYFDIFWNFEISDFWMFLSLAKMILIYITGHPNMVIMYFIMFILEEQKLFFDYINGY